MAIFLFFCLLGACSPESKEDSQPETEQTHSESRGDFSSKDEEDTTPEPTQSDIPTVEVPLEVIPAEPEEPNEPAAQAQEEPAQEEQAPIVEEVPPEAQEAPSVAEPQKDIVYITDTGSKYHRSGCRHLQDSKIEIGKDTAIAQGYEPCKTCH